MREEGSPREQARLESAQPNRPAGKPLPPPSRETPSRREDTAPRPASPFCGALRRKSRPFAPLLGGLGEGEGQEERYREL